MFIHVNVYNYTWIYFIYIWYIYMNAYSIVPTLGHKSWFFLYQRSRFSGFKKWACPKWRLWWPLSFPRNAWHKKTGRVSKNPKFLYPASFTPSPVALDTAWKEHPSSSAASKAYPELWKHVQTSLHCEVVCGQKQYKYWRCTYIPYYQIFMNIDSDIYTREKTNKCL